ncbi:helix-hairpin-helix domain-containing protein, partial [Rhodopirellula sallentina]
MAVINSSDPLHAGTEIESLHENQNVAKALDETAQLLHDQKANEFRVRAYHAAANTIRSLPTSLRAMVEHDGIEGLIALPTIGKSIANLIHQYLQTGHMSLLDRLRGESHCEALFTTVPGIGRELAHRIHEHLHIETLCELDAAAWEGKLEQVPGIGAKRVQSIKDALAIRFAKGMSDAATEKDTKTNA